MAPGSLNLSLEAFLLVMTSSHPTLAGDSSASGVPVVLLGDQGQLPCGDTPRSSPSWVQSCASQNTREGGRIWVIIELKAGLGVVQPENMDVCTVSPSENKYR